MSTYNRFRLLDYISFIGRMHETMGNAKIIKALYETSQAEWDRSFDSNTGTHLIEGVFTSPQKTDAVKIYISKMMKMHMNSIGSRLTAWTKDTIASENTTNVAISNRIAASEYKDNMPLFLLVATRLMGYDDGLVRFALMDEADVSGKTKELMNYLSAQYDLSVVDTCATKLYVDQAVRIEGLIKTDTLDVDYALQHVDHAIEFFKPHDDAPIDLWDLFENLAIIIEVNEERRLNGPAEPVDQPESVELVRDDTPGVQIAEASTIHADDMGGLSFLDKPAS